ncbi:hypothetical protein P7K49_020500, partial [Saguinus oedipus]
MPAQSCPGSLLEKEAVAGGGGGDETAVGRAERDAEVLAMVECEQLRAISISKAINTQEAPVKEKHAR